MEDCGSEVYEEDIDAQFEMGHSESKGAKKREKSVVNGNTKPSRGVATSFGFRRRPASSSRVDDNSRRKAKDRNGNGGSTEDLRAEDVLSGRSTPLARPRKEANGQVRSNRFGCRQPAPSKTAKVSDVGPPAEPAFLAKDAAINNNAFDKKSTNTVPYAGLAPSAAQAPVAAKTVTKTVILTYQTQQYPVQQYLGQEPRRPGTATRCQSASRAEPRAEPRAPRYTLHSAQLPRPQYPALRTLDHKGVKQVANNTRKISNSSDGWREGASSAVSTDSGVCTGGEGSPRPRRRPRNLQMVMKNAHSFHLKDLQDDDLDIMDDAVVTGESVIPLPKLPSCFDEDVRSPDYEANPVPTYQPPSPILPRPTPVPEISGSPMSTLERYRNRSRRVMLDSKEEEKFVFDRAEPESLKKQNSFSKVSGGVTSPGTVASSKESSPSCKSEASHTWQTQAAGEAMANRSQDDASLALSVSSCEDDKSKRDAREYHNTAFQNVLEEMPRKTVVVMDAPHPLLMKSQTLSQDAARMMTSMTSSNYSTTSTCTNQSAEPPLTLTLEESKFDMAAKFDMSALETSTQSLIDDETSPADSLISSTSTSGSNNDLNMEREATVSSSAYQTANTKTKSPEPVDDDVLDGEVLPRLNDESSPQKSSPLSPSSPTHASLSLSDGRDYFDDEIADQPQLLFRKNTEGSPLSKTVEDVTKHLRRSHERITASPLVQRNRKLGHLKGEAERTPSLDTLSSLASDDLMMDNDLGRSVTSLQSVDDYIERLDSSLRNGLNSLDERQLRQELASSKHAVRQWSQLLAQSNMLDQQLAAIAHGSTTQSLTASNTSLGNNGASLPVRTARLLQRSRAQTPSEGLCPEAATPPPPTATLLQDVVDIKTLLLQLKRVLQEPEEEHLSMSSETLDPLLAACAESPRGANGRRPPPSPLPPDAAAEMRRQIVFLQSQLEERDRAVRALQTQMSRLSDARCDDVCSVATQTDRLRPSSTILTSSENSGLVSWNEQSSGRKLPTFSEAQKTRRPTNGSIPVKCQCGAKKLNGAETDKKELHLRTNSRVGSKYLQAVTTNTDKTRHYIKRDSSVDAKTIRRTLMYSNRSKSIENFHNQMYTTKDPNIVKNILTEDTIKHHTSYGDLYNGSISSKESVNGSRKSPSLNGQSTDTDYSSDGGYKSLPSNINYNGVSPKKLSGIPRRSIEHRFVSKSVKASAI